MYLTTKKFFQEFQWMKGEKKQKLYHFYIECEEIARKVRKFQNIHSRGGNRCFILYLISFTCSVLL